MSSRVALTIIALLGMLLPHCHCAVASCCGSQAMQTPVMSGDRDCCHHDHATNSHEDDSAPLHSDRHHCCSSPDHDAAVPPTNETLKLNSGSDFVGTAIGTAGPCDLPLSLPLMERTRCVLVTPLHAQKVLCRWKC